MLFGAQANYYSPTENRSEHHFTDTMDTGIVQHPPGKRTLDMRHAEGAPRAKRRFEKVSARFEHFSISNNAVSGMGQSLESSSDDDDLIQDATAMGDEIPHLQESTASTIEEPEDESGMTTKRLRLADELSEYLEKAKEHPIIWKKMMEESRVSEGALTVWRPPVPMSNPFDDPSMKGRIKELDEDEDEIDHDGDVVIDDEIAHAGEVRPEVSYPDDPYRDSPSTYDSIPSTLSSTPDSSSCPDSESGYGNRIVEIADGGTSTDSSLEDDDAMEMD